jgi:hypothetical protein
LDNGDDEDDDALLDCSSSNLVRPLMPAMAPGGLAAAIQGDFQILVGGCTAFIAGGGCILTRALDTSAPIFYGEHKKRERRKESLRRELRRISDGMAKLQAMVAARAASGRGGLTGAGARAGAGGGGVAAGGGVAGRGLLPGAKWSEGLISMMKAPPAYAAADGAVHAQPQQERRLADNAAADATGPPRGLFKMSEANIARQAAAALVVQQGAFVVDL